MLRFSDPPAWAKGCFLAVQGKSKERVQDVGEVFTNECEVNAMLDMVKSETERIDSRFLEPPYDNGNFLAEVLRRKLSVVASRYRKSATDCIHGAVAARKAGAEKPKTAADSGAAGVEQGPVERTGSRVQGAPQGMRRRHRDEDRRRLDLREHRGQGADVSVPGRVRAGVLEFIGSIHV